MKNLAELKTYASVLGYQFGYTKEEAEDIAAEALLVALRLHEEAPGLEYLKQAMKNKAVDLLRRERIRRHSSIDNHLHLADERDETLQVDDRAYLAPLLSSLPEDKRLLLVTTAESGWDFEHAATVLGYKAKPFKHRVRRALIAARQVAA